MCLSVCPCVCPRTFHILTHTTEPVAVRKLLKKKIPRGGGGERGRGGTREGFFSFLFFSFFFALNSSGLIMVFRTWFSGLGISTWGLGNFRIWFSRHGFRDLGSQLWGLDFHTGASEWPLATGTH
jgi:hypothetical protein